MVENQNKALTIDKFNRYLESKGCRKTPERYAILDEILGIDGHFDVETLCDSMAQSGYKVSKTTIYNNLELLEACGIVLRHTFLAHTVYEKAEGKAQHIHLVCNVCGKVKDVRDSDLIRYLNKKKYSPFNDERYSVTVYGICNSCARKTKKNKSQQCMQESKPIK